MTREVLSVKQFSELSCTAFADALASKTPAPGGGGSAAMTGALGIALCSMAGHFTVGKKKYAAYEADLQRMLEECDTLRSRLLFLIDADAQGFEPLSRAYALPKDAPDRDAVMKDATISACQAPMEVISCCGRALTLLEEMLEKSSRLLITDVGCGALLCKAAMESAALNVFINTASLTDRETARQMEQQVDKAIQTYLPLADKISAAVTAYIRKED